MTLVLIMQIGRPVPAPSFTAAVPTPVPVAGSQPVLPWPALGEAAVSVPDSGLLVPSGPETPVPVASLTKVMTAYEVLRDHPLGPEAQGPVITMTQADQSDSAADAHSNATSVPVVAGQHFTERQLLDGLIVHSANDFADALARWDSGSVKDFVSKMNTEAQALSMHETHYVDPSGIDPGDTSTAADQLRVADAAMQLPAFAAVAAQPAIAVPGVGLLANYVPAVGSDGVVGVKSGFTQAAMGCVVLAAERQVAGRSVLVLAALTGQQGGYDPIRRADATAISLVDAVAGGLEQQTLVGAGRAVGALKVPWLAHGLPVVTASAVSGLVWPGDEVRYSVHVGRLRAGVRSGDVVGSLTVREGPVEYRVPVVTTASVPAPSLHWRLTHR